MAFFWQIEGWEKGIKITTEKWLKADPEDHIMFYDFVPGAKFAWFRWNSDEQKYYRPGIQEVMFELKEFVPYDDPRGAP